MVSMEQTNFRYLTAADFPEGVRFDFCCADVSFIYLTKVLPPAVPLLKDGARIVCLVKPQFEAGREHVGKNGIVRDPQVQEETVRRIAAFGEEIGLSAVGRTDSPILGSKGNREFLLYFIKDGEK